MILKNSSKLIEIDENLMKTKLFVTKIMLVTLVGINVKKNYFGEANREGLDVELITLVTKCIDFMRFLSISINLLKIFRIISFAFTLKYLSQNSINFNM